MSARRQVELGDRVRLPPAGLHMLVDRMPVDRGSVDRGAGGDGVWLGVQSRRRARSRRELGGWYGGYASKTKSPAMNAGHVAWAGLWPRPVDD